MIAVKLPAFKLRFSARHRQGLALLLTPKVQMNKFLKPIFALLLTPTLIISAPSLDLFINNQVDFASDLFVLKNIFVYFALTIVLGFIIFLYDRNKLLILKTYLLSGPIFLLVQSLLQLSFSKNPSNTIFLGGSVCLFVLGILALQQISKNKLITLFYIPGLIFFTFQSIRILPLIINYKPPAELSFPKIKSSNKTSPNIYHFIFDEYQSDMFDLSLSSEARKSLKDFTYFNDTSTAYSTTGMSLPSIFLGNTFDTNLQQIDFQKSAFNKSGKSLLDWLKSAGYRIFGVVYPIYDFIPSNFDKIAFHQAVATNFIRSSNQKLFEKFWLYKILPPIFHSLIFSKDDREQLKAKNFISYSSPILSYESLTNFIKYEPELAKNSRYTLIHLILPHFPYVLNSDCSYLQDQVTSPLEQSQCATKIMQDFIETLKRLNRYDSSIIIFQSDHGSRFSLENNQLVNVEGKGRRSPEWTRARSRALLLFKAVGANQDNLIIDNFPASLLDIAPSLAGLSQVKIPSNLKIQGIDLFDFKQRENNSTRERFYYFYEKKGANDWTDTLEKFLIKEPYPEKLETIKINIPK